MILQKTYITNVLPHANKFVDELLEHRSYDTLALAYIPNMQENMMVLTEAKKDSENLTILVTKSVLRTKQSLIDELEDNLKYLLSKAK